MSWRSKGISEKYQGNVLGAICRDNLLYYYILCFTREEFCNRMDRTSGEMIKGYLGINEKANPIIVDAIERLNDGKEVNLDKLVE